MVQIEFLCFLDKISFWWSLGSLQAHFLRSFWDLNLGLGRLNPQKWRFGRHLKKRPEKHVKKVTRLHATSPPGSLKEPAECRPAGRRPADQQTEQKLRDTPLRAQAHGGGLTFTNFEASTEASRPLEPVLDFPKPSQGLRRTLKENSPKK